MREIYFIKKRKENVYAYYNAIPLTETRDAVPLRETWWWLKMIFK